LDAALAFRNWAAAVSELDGENKKTNMTTHNTTPTMTVSGFVRLNERTGPIASVVLLGVLDSMVFRGASSLSHLAASGTKIDRPTVLLSSVENIKNVADSESPSLPQSGGISNEFAPLRELEMGGLAAREDVRRPAGRCSLVPVRSKAIERYERVRVRVGSTEKNNELMRNDPPYHNKSRIPGEGSTHR
jgi:hypothetical protein